MTQAPPTAGTGPPLITELRWLVRLRWAAGSVVIAGALAAGWLTEFGRPQVLTLALGGLILTYNLPLWAVLRGPENRRRDHGAMHAMAWVQIALDLVCLTVATMLTGGANSPVRGFFVLHMVLSSLLLSPRNSYLAAVLAMALVVSGLWMSAQWPTDAQQILLLAAWCALLLLTVYLTSRITRDLRRRDATIREQHQRMDAIVQTAVDGIITIDERGIIHSANAAAEQLFKYPPGGLIGRNVSVLMPREIAAEHDQYLRNYLSTRQAKIIGIGREVIGQASDGETIPLDLSVSEVPLDGRMLFTGILRNISERKRNEDELRSLSAELQRHQQWMIQNEKMTAMGQMAAGIVHEISNPLASMDSVLQLVSRHPERLNDGALRTLSEQLQRVHRIVRQLTEFAHPNDTLWEIRPLNDLVVAALDMVRFDRRSRSVQIEFELDSGAGDVRVMPPAMQQVLVNMTLNAFDALSEVEAPRLVVATAVRNSWKEIEIRDNGHGIAPEHLPHVFEPFFTTKPLGHGTGLGLSISYSLIKRHGGECEVTSRLGQGTTFRILLPVPTSAGANTDSGYSCPQEVPRGAHS